MRKFTTSLFIALLALLALPEKAWAWTDLRLRSSIYENWNTSYSSGTTDESSFQKVGDDANKWTKTIDATSITTDIYFRLYTTDNSGKEVQPSVDNTDITNTGVYSSAEFVDGKGSKSFCLKQSTNHYDTYTIYAEFTDKWNITVTTTNSGSSDPVSYALVGDNTNWKWNDSYVFTNTAENTYSLDIDGSTFSGKSFKLKYKKGSNEGWAAGPATNHLTITLGEAVSFNGDDDKNYVFPTLENKDYVIELTTTATTAGSFTVKEKTSAPETKYTVTVSSADATMGTVKPSGEQQIGSTGVQVTAEPASGYEFDYWTASEGVTVANPSSASTKVTATQAGTLTANFKKSTPIPGFYLVGDFLNTDNSINYNCRYFKLSEGVAAAARESVEQYSINIPTTLAVNVQVLAINEDGSTALYGPSGELAINKTNPAGSDTTTGDLVAATNAPTNYFKFEDRTTGRTGENPNPDANDGLYTITITVTNGVPTNYTIKHNPLTRVAYYLPDSPNASVKESLNSRDQETGTFNNVFFGRVYLPAGVACYVLSNYLGDYDSDKKTDTKTKLYLQGNRSGGNPDTNADGSAKDNYTKVYPITDDNGNPTGAKPFIFSTDEIMAMNLEYAPRRGNNTYAADNIYGEVIRSQKGTQAEDGTSITVPTIKVLKMVGPAVGDDTWDYNNGVVMDYNMAEQCWEATINTTAAAGAKFRFVANGTWGNSWQEDGTEDKYKAKIPYDGAGEGHAATAADPNEVSYISLESFDKRDPNYDIIFNRNPGKWRVRFYFTSKQIGTGDKYQYIFKYTINGYKSVLRTYCSDVAQKPTADSNIKVYGAYAFDGDEETKSGTIKLYEMNYIPAKHGVILYSTNTIDDATIETVMESYTGDDTMYKNIPDNKYTNYLKGTLVDTEVNASVFEGEERTHRNFFFNYFKNTGYYKQGDTDYLGFFRIKSGSTCKAHHAYLSLPTNILAWNGQTLEEVMGQYEESGDTNNLTTKGMRIIFSDGSDWDDNTTTGISVIPQTKPTDDAYYTLQGVRVAAPTKGIYIHKGKKIIVK